MKFIKKLQYLCRFRQNFTRILPYYTKFPRDFHADSRKMHESFLPLYEKFAKIVLNYRMIVECIESIQDYFVANYILLICRCFKNHNQTSMPVKLISPHKNRKITAECEKKTLSHNSIVKDREALGQYKVVNVKV